MEEFPIQDLVRQFPDRAIRWALELPEDVRDLLQLAALPFTDDLDFSAMRPLKLSTIHDDLREEIPDVLYEIPLRVSPERTLVVCILAEHSSHRVPDIRVQLLLRMANVWREQNQEWAQKNTPTDRRIRKLVISGVLYTGEEPWLSPPQLGEQLQLPTEAARFLPHFDIFFVDPMVLPGPLLDHPNLPFAWLLKLFRNSRSSQDVFWGRSEMSWNG